MSKQSRLNKKVSKYWSNKLDVQDDVIQQISQQGFFTSGCASSPMMLVAICSLLLSQKPIYEVIDSINLFAIECITPAFNNTFYANLEMTICEFERSGLRSHVRDLRKIGRVIATMQNNGDWKNQWDHDTDRKLISGIRDEPFLPQRG